MTHDELEHSILLAGVDIHKNWQDPVVVSNIYRKLKVWCLKNQLNYDHVIRRVGDIMRECFDREPKTRDVPLEQATNELQQWVNRMNLEM